MTAPAINRLIRALAQVPDPDWADVVSHKVLVFDLADLDGDQHLSTDELPIFITPEASAQQGKYDEMRAEEHMEEVDADGNALVSWEEHRASVLSHHMGGGLSAEQQDALVEQEKEKNFEKGSQSLINAAT